MTNHKEYPLETFLNLLAVVQISAMLLTYLICYLFINADLEASKWIQDKNIYINGLASSLHFL